MDLKSSREVKHAKIFDTCLGVFQNLDQGPDRVLKTVFLNMATTLEWENLETCNFFQTIENQKILDPCLGVVQSLDQGPGGALKTVFFNMAIILEQMDLEA